MEEERKTRLYWIGPHETLVPINVTSVTACDGGNYYGRDGSITEMAIFDKDDKYVDDLGQEKYLAEYATLGEHGHYYYKIGEKHEDPFHYDREKTSDVDCYWVGPHGMLVPSDVPFVIAENGIDLHHADGLITVTRPSRDHYLEVYGSNDRHSRLWYYYERHSTNDESSDDNSMSSSLSSSISEGNKKRKIDF